MKVDKVANFINTSKPAQKVLAKVSKNPAVFSTGVSCVIAGVLRPTAIAMTPMEDKQDKKYSIASSVAAGITELITAPLLFIPFGKMLSKSGDLLKKSSKTIFSNNDAMINGYKSVSNRLFKMAVVPAIAMFRFAAVSPIVKTLFGKKEDVKKNG